MLMKARSDAGTLTLEASILMPMFIFIMLFINGVFITFMGQHIMSHACIQAAKSLSLDPYTTQRMIVEPDSKLGLMFAELFTFGHGDYVSTEEWYEGDSSDVIAEIRTRFAAFLRSKSGKADKYSANKLLKAIGVVENVDQIDFSGSTVKDGVLTINMKYTQGYLFNMFDFATFSRKISLKIRLFEYKTI